MFAIRCMCCNGQPRFEINYNQIQDPQNPGNLKPRQLACGCYYCFLCACCINVARNNGRLSCIHIRQLINRVAAD